MRFCRRSYVSGVRKPIFSDKLSIDYSFNSNNHWRLGIIEKPAGFMEGKASVTHSKLWSEYLTYKIAYFTFWIPFEMDVVPQLKKKGSCFRPYF